MREPLRGHGHDPSITMTECQIQVGKRRVTLRLSTRQLLCRVPGDLITAEILDVTDDVEILPSH